MAKKYIVTDEYLSHSGDGRTYRKGEEVTLEHLSAEQIQALLYQGAVSEKGAETKAESPRTSARDKSDAQRSKE